MYNFMFFFNSALLGVGLAMDAFSVSLANGLNEPKMRKSKMGLIALTFAFFQAAMPLIGWICVHTVVECFKSFEKFIPWIALILLCYIGGSMLVDGIKNKDGDAENIKKLLDSDVGISFTGVAGPDELEGNPVGTVFVGLALPGREPFAKKLKLGGMREGNRVRSVKYGCHFLLHQLKQ